MEKKTNEFTIRKPKTISAHAGQLGDAHNIQIKYKLSNFTQDSSHDP